MPNIMGSFLFSTLLAVSLTAASGPVVELPIAGAPLSDEALAAIEQLPGVRAAALDREVLSLEVAPDSEVSVSDIVAVLTEHAPGSRLERDGVTIGAHTIFQMNAGVCFFCAEGPLGQTLARRSFVSDWSVVDYYAKGRLRFRVDADGKATIGALGGTSAFEDIIITDRYEGLGAPNLYWATGGVAWRANEAIARQEASRSQKPLILFPTAGT
ncbi:MAG: hypothetical protein VYB87_01670 [Acidobacteriota bacterium]|nr:hypothetical protein [Acidobacteriota bacterium]